MLEKVAVLDEFGDRLAAFRQLSRSDDSDATDKILQEFGADGHAERDIVAELFPEALNDEVTWTYNPMEPWHLAFSPGIHPVSVRVDGELLIDAGVPTLVDATEIRTKAAEQAARLFARLS